MRQSNSSAPNFFAVGSVKAASTALNQYLRSHPQIYMSPLKEPHFFSKDVDPRRFSREHRNAITTDYKAYLKTDMKEEMHFAYVRDWDDYLDLFRYANGQVVVGESSNSYLYSKVAAEEIRRAIPHAKITMVLRNPVERAFSHWVMDQSIGYARGPFMQEIEADLADPDPIWGSSRLYVWLGMYSAQVERYLRVFPENQIKILLANDLRDRRRETIRELYAFLGVDYDFVPPLETVNEAQIARWRGLNRLMHQSGIKLLISRYVPGPIKSMAQKRYYRTEGLPKLTTPERARLLEIFSQDILKLQTLIGRDLSGWLQ
jgi:hypothetical protein